MSRNIGMAVLAAMAAASMLIAPLTAFAGRGCKMGADCNYNASGHGTKTKAGQVKSQH